MKCHYGPCAISLTGKFSVAPQIEAKPLNEFPSHGGGWPRPSPRAFYTRESDAPPLHPGLPGVLRHSVKLRTFTCGVT
jgi:hypothetical protein